MKFLSNIQIHTYATGIGYIFFLIFDLKHRLWVLKEAVVMCIHNQCFKQKLRKILFFI